MDLMELRRGLLLRPRVRTIGGLPVLIDNAFYSSGNGKFDNVVSSDQYFISGFFDTGSTGSKSITFSYTANVMSAYTTYFRLFNDITANSYDYWGNAEKPENLPKTRTLTTGGRFIAFPVYKPQAGNMYMYDNTNQRYIFKGSSIPNFIDGIPVLIDNVRYAAQNGTFDGFVSDSNYFLTGWFDTGSTGTKQYVFGPAGGTNYSANMTARWFDTKTGNSVDYWRPFDTSTKTIDTAGQFIVATVYKPTASTYYLYDNTNGVYLFKGKNV